MPLEQVKAEMTAHRDTIKLLVANAAQFVAAALAADAQEGQNKSEIIANAIIAMRALEDAAMRFGKVIQAASGGVSPLGGPDTPAKG